MSPLQRDVVTCGYGQNLRSTWENVPRIATRRLALFRGLSRILRGLSADDATDLERLPEPLDRVPAELGELVEEQDTVVRQGSLMSPE